MSYSIYVQEDENDRQALLRKKYSLQAAVAVADPLGKPSFNVVYSSSILGPNMPVSWDADYGMNWSTQMPAPGRQVVYSGVWTACKLGESFSLDKTGGWQEDLGNPNAKPNCLNVARNDYVQPVHIIIGVRSGDRVWRPIWVSPEPLIPGAHGEYEPLQSVQVWFQEGDKTASIIYNTGTKTCQHDKLEQSKPWYFHYIAAKGAEIWQDQDKPFDLQTLSTEAAMAADVEVITDLIPLISVRRGVYFKNLNYGPIYITQENEVSA